MLFYIIYITKKVVIINKIHYITLKSFYLCISLLPSDRGYVEKY